MSILHNQDLLAEIECSERTLRTALDELDLQVSMGVRAPYMAYLLQQCKKMADAHQQNIARLGAGENEDALRRAAACLAERLLLFAREFALHSVH
jgi:hypothetical protein